MQELFIQVQKALFVAELLLHVEKNMYLGLGRYFGTGLHLQVENAHTLGWGTCYL